MDNSPLRPLNPLRFWIAAFLVIASALCIAVGVGSLLA
jgi:hypothetical protein